MSSSQLTPIANANTNDVCVEGKTLRTDSRVVVLSLPVAVPASAAGDARASTAPRVASFLASHPTLLGALVADVEPEVRKKDTAAIGGGPQSPHSPMAAPPAAAAVAPNAAAALIGCNGGGSLLMRKGFAGRFVPVVDNSREAPTDVMASPRQFLERQMESVACLPWGSFRPAPPPNHHQCAGGGAMSAAAALVASLPGSPTLASPTGAVVGAVGGSNALVAGVSSAGAAEGGMGDLYKTQAPSVMYTPGHCTNFVVEVVTRRLKDSARLRDAEKREREEAGDGEGPSSSSAAGGAEMAPPPRRRPIQQVIGYRLDSVATRNASLAIPASFCFGMAAPEVGLRTAAFPPASFFREQRQTVYETLCRYEDDVGDGAARHYKPPPTQNGTWPPTREAPVPSKMGRLHASGWGRGTEAERQCARDFFGACPIWPIVPLLRRMAESGRCPRSHLAKVLVVSCSYIFANGPFGRLRIRLGYDPSADPLARYFQRLVVRLTSFSPIRLTIRELSSAPECAAVLAELRAEADAAPIALLDAAAMEAEHAAEKTGGAATGPTRVRFTTDRRQWPVYRESRVHFYCSLLLERRQFWTVLVDQYLDDSAFVAIMNHRPLLRRCDEVTGWFHIETHDRLMAYVRDDFSRWMLEEVAPRIAAAKEANGGGGGAASASSPLLSRAGASSDALGAVGGGPRGDGSDDGGDSAIDGLDDDDLEDLADGLSDLGSVGGDGDISSDGLGDDDFGDDDGAESS